MSASYERLNETPTAPAAAAALPAYGAGKGGGRIARYGEGLAALASGVLTAAAWGTEDVWGPGTASIVLYLLAYVVGGYVKAKEGLETLIAERDLDVNLLMILAAIGAACIGYWAEGAVLIFIFSLSGALESYTMARSHRDISSLMECKPETATLVRNGEETVVPVERLEVGDIVVVRPGERIPADGVVKEGASAVNQASITGESVPVDKMPGDDVFAGTMNGQGALFVEVTQPSASTLFAKIIRMVQEAQSEKPASQRFIERFERIYARIILAATALLIVIPPLLLGWSWSQTFYKAMVFLVVASPCALVASIMPAVLSAISNGARHGLLLKGGAYLEHLAEAKVVAFDKTGTLTEGRPVVTDLIAYGGKAEEEVLRIAASLESLSEHPLAEAVLRHAEERGVRAERPSDWTSLTGLGVQAQFEGELWRIGKPAMLDDTIGRGPAEHDIERLEGEGKTVVALYSDRGIAGVIAMRDRLRPEAKTAIARLRELGVRVAMLTGDQSRTAHAIAAEAGIDFVYAELLPQDKAERIKELQQSYGCVVMAGDGVNDAPALATATVGAAMGATGSDAALETADLVLMNDDIGHIATAVELGRRTRAVVRQNLTFAIAVIAMLIFSNFALDIALPFGVVGHEGSTILVILNGLRLLR